MVTPVLPACRANDGRSLLPNDVWSKRIGCRCKNGALIMRGILGSLAVAAMVSHELMDPHACSCKKVEAGVLDAV